MKTASAALISYLQNTSAQIAADCFTFTLLDGTILRYTAADVPVTVNGSVFAANGPQVTGLKYKLSVGVNIDEQTISIAAKSTDLVKGLPFLVALQRGVFDGATLQRERAFFAAWGTPAIGSVVLFHGRISTLDRVGRTVAEVKVKTDLVVLNEDAPRNIFQAACLHVFGDSGCGVNLAAWTVTGAAGNGSANSTVVWPAGNVYAAGYFSQGTLVWTGGPNAGVETTVGSSDAQGNLTLNHPLDNPPGVGDTFAVCAGCDHTLATCTAKFNNATNFRGFDLVPPPEVAY